MKNTWGKALLCGFIVSVACSFVNFSGKCDNISNKVFRLHIIANSNSDEDQSLKLKVRDRILKDFSVNTSKVKDMQEAEIVAKNNIERLRISAQDEVYRNGYNYPVKAEIVNMHFNTRFYENVALPAGNYDAFRITIGEAQGKNWWCVMFPPMCLPAAESEKCIDDVLTETEADVVTNFGKYSIEFKTFEIFSEVNNFLICHLYNPFREYFSHSDNFKYEMSFSFENLFD